MLHSIDVAKTHEIMARFRPIAPKPTPHLDNPAAVAEKLPPAAALYHRRARCCRARKRAQVILADSTLPSKRQKTLSELVTLSLLPCAADAGERVVPVEQDLLQKLQEPKVIVPQPVRPVGSRINITCISSALAFSAPSSRRRPKEVEEELESEALPAVVSDSSNRVRLANSAYKEMVGQPECPWLDSMVLSGSSSSRRINGEVMLQLPESSALPESSGGFSCRANIEWTSNGETKSIVDAPCDVIRLYCESNKDYLFAWRFRITEEDSKA